MSESEQNEQRVMSGQFQVKERGKFHGNFPVNVSISTTQILDFFEPEESERWNVH